MVVGVTEPFIKGEYLSTRDDGIATVKMAWKLADGKPAMAYTHQDNVVAVKTSQPSAQPGSTVGAMTLNTGANMPCFGLGTFLGEPGVVGKSVVAALKAGYRHLDCASMYNNEKEIGEVCCCDLFCQSNDLFVYPY